MLMHDEARHAEVPDVLVINASGELLDSVRWWIKEAFASESFTIYSRPVISDHPRMQVSRRGKGFSVILIDAVSISGDGSGSDLTQLAASTEWLRNDVARRAPKALKVFVAPNHLASVFREYGRGCGGPTSVIVRELLTSPADGASQLRAIWTEWRQMASVMKPNDPTPEDWNLF